jgi:hypothetical protein
MTDPTAASALVPWATCRAEEGCCLGVRLEAGDFCLAHTEPSTRRDVFQRLADGLPLTFVRGVPFTPDLLADLLAAAPTDDDNEPMLRQALFMRAHFEGDAGFDGASFHGDARFDDASFHGDARFDDASFHGDARFDDASFHGDARFDDASFHGDAQFSVFFHGDARFDGATFQGFAGFQRAHFRGTTGFEGVHFQGGAVFEGADFQGSAGFDGVDFRGPARFGPLRVTSILGLSQAVFAQPVRFEVDVATVIGRELRLEGGGGTIGLHDPAGGALLDGAALTEPVTLVAVGSPGEAGFVSEPRPTGPTYRGNGSCLARAKVLGMRGVDASNLVLIDVDLAVC